MRRLSLKSTLFGVDPFYFSEKIYAERGGFEPPVGF